MRAGFRINASGGSFVARACAVLLLAVAATAQAARPVTDTAPGVAAPVMADATMLAASATTARRTGALQFSCPTGSTLCGCRNSADCKVLEGSGNCSGPLQCTFNTSSGQPECTCTRKAALRR